MCEMVNRKLQNTLFAVSFLLLFVGCNALNTEDAFVENLLSQMTLEEKLGQMILYSSGEDPTVPVFNPGYQEEISQGRCGAIFASISMDSIKALQQRAVSSRLGIPLLFGYDVLHGYKTVFPVPLAEAASWDTLAIKQAAEVAAREASSCGINWFFGPMIDIARDARWGRVSEGAGEDVFLTSIVAATKVNAYQKGFSSPHSVAACAKHFVAYGAPQGGRDYNTVILSEQELQDIYLPPFQAAVESGVATVMCAFNEINGTPCSSNSYVLKDVLQKQMGFDGFVVTDFASIRELMNHGVAESETEAAALAINAGVHMDMESAIYKIAYVEKLLNDGTLSMETIDDAVRRILLTKYRLGLFDDPFKYCKLDTNDLMGEEALQVATDLAKKSIVLLKNENQILPLAPATQKIALIGPMAKNQADCLGTWIAQGDTASVVTLWDALSQEVDNSRLLYAAGCPLMEFDTSGFSEAIKIASKSDIILLALGDKGDWAGEAASRVDIELPRVQRELLHTLSTLNKPIVLLLHSGRPLVLTNEVEHCQSVVACWQLGTMSGTAITEVLLGRYNPSGKLPIAFPRHVGQLPMTYAHKNTGRPSDPNVRYTSRYLDTEHTPLYPFGFGLSYSTFRYDSLEIKEQHIQSGNSVEIKATVTNTSSLAGDEVVQLYVQDMYASVTRPVKELKAFRKVNIPAQTTKSIEFKLATSELMFTNAAGKKVLEPGKFTIYVGTDSSALLSDTFEIY